MTTRRVTYGYQFNEDGIGFCAVEREVVLHIFSQYISGISQKQIVKDLTNQGIKTPSGKDVWSQGMVRAILTDKRYLGDNFHPQMITEDMFHDAEMIRSEKNKKIIENMTKSKMKNCYTNKITCERCGGHYLKKRVLPKGVRGIPTSNWICENYLSDDCDGSVIKENVLDDFFMRLVNEIRINPSLIHMNDQLDIKTNFTINRLDVHIQNEIRHHQMDRIGFNHMVLKRAQEMYAISENHNKEFLSNKIVALVRKAELKNKFDEELFLAIVKAIYVYDDHTITFLLINDVRITVKGDGIYAC